MTTSIEPYLQYGALGLLALLMIVIFVWFIPKMVRHHRDVLKDVAANNTSVNQRLADEFAAQMDLQRRHDDARMTLVIDEFREHRRQSKEESEKLRNQLDGVFRRLMEPPGNGKHHTWRPDPKPED